MNIKGADVDSVNVALVDGDTGQYRIEWRHCYTGQTRFISYCYGYANSIKAARCLSLDQVECIQYPPFKPVTDTSGYM
jgi:hypothetical protein